MILRSNLPHNDDHHPQTSIVNPRRRRAKCGLIPSFQGSGRNSFKASSISLFYASSKPKGQSGRETVFWSFVCFLPGFELVPYRVYRVDEACPGVG